MHFLLRLSYRVLGLNEWGREKGTNGTFPSSLRANYMRYIIIRAPLQKNTVEPYALIGWQGWQD